MRAKVFDDLIAENAAEIDLPTVTRKAEMTCLNRRGWDVCLIDEPLFGIQDQPINTITEAREVMSKTDCQSESYCRNVSVGYARIVRF